VDTAPRDRTNSAVPLLGAPPRGQRGGVLVGGALGLMACGTMEAGTVAAGTVAAGTVEAGTASPHAAFGVFFWLEVLDFDLFFGFLPFLHG
jgi:hypothetical protein